MGYLCCYVFCPSRCILYIQMEKVKLCSKKPSLGLILQHLSCSLVLGTMSTEHLLPDVARSSWREKKEEGGLPVLRPLTWRSYITFFIIIIIINNIIFYPADISTYSINSTSFFQWNHINRKRIAACLNILQIFHLWRKKLAALVYFSR